MKKRAFAIATVLVLSIAAAAGVANAQQAPMVANIPFAFVVGSQTLPAGEYRIEPLLSSGPHVLLIKRIDGRRAATLLTNAVDARDWQSESKLVFNRYGDRYFLCQIWSAGSRLGRELPMSPREKELASRETRREVILLAGSYSPKR